MHNFSIHDKQPTSHGFICRVPADGHGHDPADPAWGAAFAHIANWVGKVSVTQGWR